MGRAQLLPEHLDICAVLWHAAAGGTPALRVSEIFDLVSERCHRLGKDPPAQSTLAGYLRTLVEWKYVKPVQIADRVETKKLEPLPVRVRGIVRGAAPPARSPNTGYQALGKPRDVLESVFRTLVDAYPPAERLDALLTLARALDLSGKEQEKIAKLATEIRQGAV